MNTETQQTAIFKDPQTQAALNAPLVKNESMSATDEAFLNIILEFVAEGKINLYQPSTLLNHAVYDLLDQGKQGKADMEAMNLLTSIREIKGLCDAGFRQTFQVENLVSRLKMSKERVEELGGDLFII